MMNNHRLPAFVIALALALPSTVLAQSARYDDCRREAREISGYEGEESGGFLSGAVRGGLGGAALGAAGGWVTDSKVSKTARRGAALGAIIGGVRAAAKSKKADEKRQVYERALDRCFSRQP
jgi:hypothetical protein